ncbi:MAG: hypothetical protein WAN36_07250, partial [Calditrichia bacterium]
DLPDSCELYLQMGTSPARFLRKAPLQHYFDFRISNNLVRVVFHKNALALLGTPCRIKWIDYYRE